MEMRDTLLIILGEVYLQDVLTGFGHARGWCFCKVLKQKGAHIVLKRTIPNSKHIDYEN